MERRQKRKLSEFLRKERKKKNSLYLQEIQHILNIISCANHMIVLKIQ